VDAGLEAWPPADAEALELGEFYDTLAALGIEYGPAFQGLTAAWRQGERLYAEVALQDDEASVAESFAIHPALLDAALHSTATALLGAADVPAGAGLQLPFSFSDLELHAPGATRLRVALTTSEDGTTSVRLADAEGAPVASIGSFSMRPLPAQYLEPPKATRDSLFSLDWLPAAEPPAADPAPRVAVVGPGAARFAADPAVVASHPDLAALVAAIDDEGAAPDVVALCLAGDAEADESDPPARLRELSAEALQVAQQWLREDPLPDARLAFVTVEALRAGERDSLPSPAQAAIWGLIRSAQTENPGRFALVDVDRSDTSAAALGTALGLAEPSVAVRDGAPAVARLRRVDAEALADTPEGGPWGLRDRAGTVLITGGTGDLGALVARHLAGEHGARHLLLASRSGAEAPGAVELRVDLEALGAEVTIAACDVSSRDQLTDLVESVGAEQPLVAVVHTAALLDDGVLDSLTPQRLEPVFAAKADAAWHLHELTEHLDLAAFVLFSSAAGTLGNPGQANYAAANAFLDGLAGYRAARGLAASSLAWGIWERTLRRGMGQIGEGDMARMGRSGLAVIDDAEGLELLDDSVALGRPTTVPLGLDFAALRSRARGSGLPEMFGELVRVPRKRAAGAAAEGSLARRLAAVPAEQHEQATLDFVLGQIADVLGHDSAAAIDPRTPFLELGFDSLTALEFRNRLSAATGLRLAPSIAFDHPTAAALATHLVGQVDAAEPAAGEAGPGLLTELLRSAHGRGQTAEFAAVLAAAAGFRERFASAAESGLEPFSTRLAEGPGETRLVCIPSAAPISGPHEYARMARGFDGTRDVLALRWPGFAALEPLPADAAAAFDLQAAAVAAATDGAPFALLGHSTGGVFAYGLARHLEECGNAPVAVVMVDSYHPSQSAMSSIGLGILSALLGAGESGIPIDDVRLTAMAAYLQLVTQLEVLPVACPTLLLRAEEPIGGDPEEDDWQPRWDVPHDIVDVAGNHLSMMDSCADSTAAAISAWLGAGVAEGKSRVADVS
jgi:thioesterase domain-containing protein/acyl carrier protein